MNMCVNVERSMSGPEESPRRRDAEAAAATSRPDLRGVT